MKKQINLIKSTSLKIEASQTISDLAGLLESILKFSIDPNKDSMLNLTRLIRSIASVMPRVEVDCKYRSVGKDYDMPNF